jgi:PhzF family phenazine biosynthesis protein
MQVEVYKLNAFTQSMAGGNPAGVVIAADNLKGADMQAIAEAVGYSETAFILKSKSADFKIRFFTPTSEVDLCGHATIAAFSLLRQKGIISDGEYSQETKAGILRLKVYGETIFMQQTTPMFFEVINDDNLLMSLGIEKSQLADNLPVQIVSTGIKDILIPLKSIEVLGSLKPDMSLIEAVSTKYGAVGYHVFSISKNMKTTAICRNFAPLYGIPEESATGTSNGALACYLFKYGVIADTEKELIFEQGRSMNKPSVISAKLELNNSELSAVWVGGEAVINGSQSYDI